MSGVVMWLIGGVIGLAIVSLGYWTYVFGYWLGSLDWPRQG